MSWDLGVGLFSLVVALLAGWLSLPRPPSLDWQRLFKVGLSVLTAAEVEAETGSVDPSAVEEWRRRVLAAVLWHPEVVDAGAALRGFGPIGTGGEEERGLSRRLADLPDPRARLRALLDDEAGQRELFGDPAELGAEHDPATWLGAEAAWEHVAAWDEGLRAALRRRFQGVRLVLDGLPPALAAAFEEALEPSVFLRLPEPGEADEEAEVEALYQPVEAVLAQPSDRIVLVAHGGAANRTLAAMIRGAGLRDRCLAVLLLAPALRPDVLARFDNERMDTELKRSVPYLVLADLDFFDPSVEALEAQRLPAPAPLPSGRAAVERVDLGVVHLAGIAPRVLARGLLLLLATRLGA